MRAGWMQHTLSTRKQYKYVGSTDYYAGLGPQLRGFAGETEWTGDLDFDEMSFRKAAPRDRFELTKTIISVVLTNST